MKGLKIQWKSDTTVQNYSKQLRKAVTEFDEAVGDVLVGGGGNGGGRLIFRVFDWPVLGPLTPASLGEDRSVLT